LKLELPFHHVFFILVIAAKCACSNSAGEQSFKYGLLFFGVSTIALDSARRHTLQQAQTLADFLPTQAFVVTTQVSVLSQEH
jgi:hypothetical protein